MIRENSIISDSDFEIAFREHFQELFAYAYTIVRNQHNAEEIVQEVFYKIWQKRKELRIDRSFRAYLYQSVHNDCMNYLKHAKVRKRYEEHLMQRKEENAPEYSSGIMNKEMEQKFLDALQQLPERCRTIFQMSRFEELKYREIAARLNLSVKTIENQMGKALKILRIHLAEFLPVLWILALIASIIKNLKQ